jgi:hypothetical protein
MRLTGPSKLILLADNYISSQMRKAALQTGRKSASPAELELGSESDVISLNLSGPKQVLFIF